MCSAFIPQVGLAAIRGPKLFPVYPLWRCLSWCSRVRRSSMLRLGTEWRKWKNRHIYYDIGSPWKSWTVPCTDFECGGLEAFLSSSPTATLRIGEAARSDRMAPSHRRRWTRTQSARRMRAGNSILDIQRCPKPRQVMGNEKTPPTEKSGKMYYLQNVPAS